MNVTQIWAVALKDTREHEWATFSTMTMAMYALEIFPEGSSSQLALKAIVHNLKYFEMPYK